MPTVRDELIELRGLRFYYRDWESVKPDAQTLVLLHGYTGHARSWDAFAEAMSSRYRVLALDQRGHGQTDWAPATAYDTSEMVEDVAAFVKALGLSNFVLLGLSMGGLVSIGYAGKRPAGLAKLVIVDIAPEIDVEGLRRIQAGVVRSDVFESVEEAYERARADNPIPPDDQLRHRIEYSLMRRGDGKFTYRYDKALRSVESTQRYSAGRRLAPGREHRRTHAAGAWRTERHSVASGRGKDGESDSELSARRSRRVWPSGAARQTRRVPRFGRDVHLDESG